MSAPEIHAKLEAFLARHPALTEECHVVYLLVELRKIMDQLWTKRDFLLVRFYADWSVHSQKDRVTAEVEKIAEAIYTETGGNAGQGVPVPSTAKTFSHMEGLRLELADLLQAIRVDARLTGDPEKWSCFVGLLTSVLADQPIVNPSAHVREIRFEPHSQECVITFSQPAGGHTVHREVRS